MSQPRVITENASLAPIEELDRVRLTRGVVAESGAALLEGWKGTVVSTYGAGEAFCVEFTSPLQALATVGRGDIEVVAEETRARLASLRQKVSSLSLPRSRSTS